MSTGHTGAPNSLARCREDFPAIALVLTQLTAALRALTCTACGHMYYRHGENGCTAPADQKDQHAKTTCMCDGFPVAGPMQAIQALIAAEGIGL